MLARHVPFADLLPALAVVEVADRYTADSDWGPLLLAAFPGVTLTPGPRPPPPASLDGAHLARMRVGLPETRNAVAEPAR